MYFSLFYLNRKTLNLRHQSNIGKVQIKDLEKNNESLDVSF